MQPRRTMPRKFFSMKFVTHNQSAEPVQPSEQPPYDLTAQKVAQGSAVLGPDPVFGVGRNHLDSVFFVQVPIKRVQVIRLVSDQRRVQLVMEAVGKCFIDKFQLARRGRFDRENQWRAVICGDGQELGPFASLQLVRCMAFFFAAAKLPSVKPLPWLHFSSGGSRPAGTCNALSNYPLRTHCWSRRWLIWFGRYTLDNTCHCAPVCRIQSAPFNTVRVSVGGRAHRRSRSRVFRTVQSASGSSSSARIRSPWIRRSYFLPAAISAETQAKTTARLFMRLVLVFKSASAKGNSRYYAE